MKLMILVVVKMNDINLKRCISSSKSVYVYLTEFSLKL